MPTIRQLIDEANRVIAETQQGGNTQLRIGNLYLGIIDFLDVIDKRTAEGYEYDDTALKEAIAKIDEAIALLDRAVDEAVALASEERDRLNGLIDELDTDIENKVNRMMNDAAWLEEHARGIRDVVNEGEIYWQSGWDANIEAYLQEVGVWARDGDVIKTQWSQIKQDVATLQSTVTEVQTDLEGRPTSTQWSQITQKVNSIEQSVNKLLYNGEFTEALQASINQSIDDNIASLNLDTTYAKKDTEGAKEILEWMYSAFKNASSSELTYAQMVSAGKAGINNGVSEVRTYVNAIRDGDFLKYEAVSSIEAKVDDVITGLYNKATAEDAKTTIFSQVKKDSSDIATIVTHCTKDYSSAAIATKFDNFVAGIVFQSDQERALASLAATLRDDINTSTAGLVAEATMEAAFASMTTQFNNKLAGFIAKADFEEAFVTMIAEDEDNGAVAQIFARANEAGSEIRLSADKITMTNAFADSITANTAFINFLKGGSAEFSGTITAKAGYIGGWEITEDMIRHVDKKVGLYSGSDYSSQYVESAVRFWAGGEYRDSAAFRVTEKGYMYATKGEIGGFTIGETTLGAKREGYPFLFLDTEGHININANDNYAALTVWGGAALFSDYGSVFEYIKISKNGNIELSTSHAIDLGSSLVTPTVTVWGETTFKKGIILKDFICFEGCLTSEGESGKTTTINLPGSPKKGQIVFVKGVNGNITIGNSGIQIVNEDDASLSNTYECGRKSFIFLYNGTYWIAFRCS